jgi:hypothetical protein
MATAAAFNSPEANVAFRKTLAKFLKTADAKTIAALEVVLTEGRNTVGWKATGRALLGGE